MKKLINIAFAIALLFVVSQAKADSPTDPTGRWTPNWIWSDPSSTNWQITTILYTGPVTSPFIGGVTNSDVTHIYRSLDYKPEQGWVLLGKDFGASGYPIEGGKAWFMLYNRYTAVMRLFMYNVSDISPATGANVIVEWESTTPNTSLLTLSNTYAKANNQYPITNNPEKFVFYTVQYPKDGGWMVSEATAHFDKNIDKNTMSQFIRFTIVPNQVSQVELKGAFQFKTTADGDIKSGTAKGGTNLPKGSSFDPVGTAKQIAVDGKEYLGKIPTTDKVEGYFKDVSGAVNKFEDRFCNDFTEKIRLFNVGLQQSQFKQFLLGATELVPGAIAGLNILSTVLDFAGFKTNNATAADPYTYFQPTISNGTIQLSGTISTTYSPKLGVSMQMPGGHHKVGTTTLFDGLPTYDCPLGVVSLEEPPTIEVKYWAEPEVTGGKFEYYIDFSRTACNGAEICAPLPSYNQTYLKDTTIKQYCISGGYNAEETRKLYRRSWQNNTVVHQTNLKSYKVIGDVKLALNEAAGVTIESVKAALFFEILPNSSGTPRMNIFKKSPTIQDSYTTVTNSANYASVMNPEFSDFGQGGCYDYSQGMISIWRSRIKYVDNGDFKNYTLDLLNKGELVLSNYDKDNGLHKIQTPFIDIDKFKNTAVTLEDGHKVCVKLQIIMKPKDPTADQTPIVQVVTYEIPDGSFNVGNQNKIPYPITCEHVLQGLPDNEIGDKNVVTTYPSATYTGNFVGTIEGSKDVIVSPQNTFELKAGKRIHLKAPFHSQLAAPTFFTQPKIWAHIDASAITCSDNVANALVVTPYFANCDPKDVKRIGRPAKQDGSSQESIEVSTSELTMNAYPNPNNGLFNVAFNQPIKAGELIITNFTGQIVKKVMIENTSMLNIDLQDLASGIYMITYKGNETTLLQKVSIQ